LDHDHAFGLKKRSTAEVSFGALVEKDRRARKGSAAYVSLSSDLLVKEPDGEPSSGAGWNPPPHFEPESHAAVWRQRDKRHSLPSEFSCEASAA
jgi:hypothetical protein